MVSQDFHNKNSFINWNSWSEWFRKTAVVDVFEVLICIDEGRVYSTTYKAVFDNAIDQVGENNITLELEEPEQYIVWYKVKFA